MFISNLPRAHAPGLMKSRRGAASNPGEKPCTYSCSVETPVANIGEVAGDGGGGRHFRADQMRASSAALASFKVAIAGRSAALARSQDVGIHSQAHRAARLAP